ncbi:nucleoporin 210 [Aphomia sociella]
MSDSAKINTPRVLLPWFEDLNVNFMFEIIEGGCYTWSLSRDDIIDLEPLFEDTWGGHCSRAARVSVSKTCVPPGSVIILAEEVNSGEILRGDVNIDKISSLKVVSTTWKLYLEEAPEAFEVFAYDEQGNKFSTLEGVNFKWTIENYGNSIGEDPLVTLVRWRDTDYEAPPGITEIEAQGFRSYSVLLYGQAMGECRVTVCLADICTNFNLHVVASVVLTPATAVIAPGDTLRYKVVRARAGRLTVQDVAETLYYMKVPDTGVALLDDTVSLVRATEIGTTPILLMSGATEVATATLTVAEPHSIRVNLRPSGLLIRGEVFTVHSILLDVNGHPLFAGEEILIRLSVDGEANVDLLKSTENGTLTDAVARNSGPLKITARLYSVAGRSLTRKVEGTVSAVAVDPLEIVPPEIFVAWTDTIQEITLKYHGGGEEPVIWSESEKSQGSISLSPIGVVTVRGEGQMEVMVQLKNYPHVRAVGRVWSTPVEMVQVSSSGHARVGRPHHLHVALTATHPRTGELYNFHVCNCESFAVSLLEGPEPQNVTAATWVKPIEGACCVVECSWQWRGVSSLRVSRGRAGDSARVAVRAAPRLLWPRDAVAALSGATLPVLAEGEALVTQSSEPRVAEMELRDGPPPHRYPDVHLFTFKCRWRGESRMELVSHTEDEQEAAEFEAACAPHVAKLRLEPPEAPGNCSGGPRLWLRPGHEVTLRVTLQDSIGRELLDEQGPRVSWESEPRHAGIQYKSDRLLVETHPEYAPVPVPYKYYQLVVADKQAIGWSGVLKASIPEATASIQARVVSPLKCSPLKANMAWEGEAVSSIATISGGSGRYYVESPKGVSASADGAALSAAVPGPGSYDLVVMDMCVQGEKQLVEVNIEEVLTVEVITTRALGVGACVGLRAIARGSSQRPLATGRSADWRSTGPVSIKDGSLCGLAEGSARVRAAVAGVWSPDVEVLVFPPLQILPSSARIPAGARLQLRSAGGPPSHLASAQYRRASGDAVEVSPTGSVHGLSTGTARIKLVATDIANVEIASAESEVEVVPISGLRVRAATQTLLVGAPGGLWLAAEGLAAASLQALQPPPRVVWSLRDPTAARLYSGHTDDMLERQVSEGIAVRVVPLKPGVITIDVRVRNMGQMAESRSWDSTIEILGIADIRTSVEGSPGELSTGERLAVAVGATVQLKSLPRATWKLYDDGALELSPNGELKALQTGHGVIIAQHKDERNNIYRETAIHVEASLPHYCTAEPADGDEAVRLSLRSVLGRRLLAPQANVSARGPLHAESRRATHSVLGQELAIMGLEAAGALMTFESSIGVVTVRDEVWVAGPDPRADNIFACGGWGVCLEGVGWRGDAGAVRVYPGAGVSLALLSARDPIRRNVALKLDRPPTARTIHQLPIDKMEFAPGEWPSAMVPLIIQASGLTSGPLLCTEDQRYALEGIQVELPFTCRTKAPHTAQAVLDIINGELGCSILPATPIIDSSEIELCAEWGAARTCTRVLLLPVIKLSNNKVSLLNPPAMFTITGHPHALKLVKMNTSPGLKLETRSKDGEIDVIVKSETSVCGMGWVNVRSKLTAQELRVEVQRECDVACGTLLGAIFTLLKPYLSTLATVAAVAAAFVYAQSRMQQKGKIRMPEQPAPQTPVPELNRSRTWSRSPYASGPAAPVYGDATLHPDQSFSPNTTRMHSSFPAFGL